MTDEQITQTACEICGIDLSIRKINPVIKDTTNECKNLFTPKSYEFITNEDNKSNHTIHQYSELLESDTFLEWDLGNRDHNSLFFPHKETPTPRELKNTYLKRFTIAKYTSVTAIGGNNISKASKILVDNFNDLVEKDEILKIIGRLFTIQIDSDSVKPKFIVGLFFHTKVFYKPDDEKLSLYSHEGQISSIVVGD